jgi:ornithine cyclodeaminase/alanine dehydrogenase-like protein (mu-crystallin family)
MNRMPILTEADLRTIVKLNLDAVTCVENAFRAGLKPGRREDLDVTVADLTGAGVQHTAIATLARDRARGAGAGTIFES